MKRSLEDGMFAPLICITLIYIKGRRRKRKGRNSMYKHQALPGINSIAYLAAILRFYTPACAHTHLHRARAYLLVPPAAGSTRSGGSHRVLCLLLRSACRLPRSAPPPADCRLAWLPHTNAPPTRSFAVRATTFRAFLPAFCLRT